MHRRACAGSHSLSGRKENGPVVYTGPFED